MYQNKIYKSDTQPNNTDIGVQEHQRTPISLRIDVINFCKIAFYKFYIIYGIFKK